MVAAPEPPSKLRPTTPAITCLRCRRIAGLDEVQLQVALFDLPVPRRSHEPPSSPGRADNADPSLR